MGGAQPLVKVVRFAPQSRDVKLRYQFGHKFVLCTIFIVSSLELDG